MKKKLAIIIPLLVVLALVVVVVLAKVLPASQESQEKPVDKISMVVPDGAPLLPFAQFATTDETTFEDGHLKVNAPFVEGSSQELDVHVVSGPDQLAAGMKQENPDMAVVPVNLAAKLYNDASPKYHVAAITTWGLNEVVGNVALDSLADLAGKTLYSFGKAETPGITLRALLEKQGVEYVDTTADAAVDPDKVNIIDLATAQDILAALPKGGAQSFGLLPEPVATTFKIKTEGKFDVRINLQDAWKDNFGKEQYPQAVLVVSADFLAKKGAKEFAKAFMPVIYLGAELATNDPETAVKVLAEKLQSTMFATPAPAIEAIKSGRLDVHNEQVFEVGSNLSDDTFKAQKSITDYLDTISGFSDNSSTLIGGGVPGGDFWLDLSAD